MKKYTYALFVLLACLIFIVPVSFALAAGSHGSPGSPAARHSSASVSTSASAEWSRFGYDTTGTRYNPNEKILNPSNVGTMTVNWSYTTGSYVQSSAAVVNEIVYVGSTDSTLYAFVASTGALLWSYTTGYPNSVSSSPAVANGVVYFGSTDKKLYALNASTGALVWSYTTGLYIDSSPAVANGIVYVGSDDYKQYALNAKTGALLWSYTTGAAVGTSSAIVNGVIYFGSNDYNLYALNASTGALIWSYNVGTTLTSSPTVVNGMVYVGSTDNKMYAFSLPQPMKVSPTILNFTGQAGGSNPLGQNVTLTNSGTSTFTWAASAPSSPWLMVTPTSGSLGAGISTSLTFTVNISGLAAGSYSTSVVLTPSVGSPVTIVVRLTLT